MSVVVVVVVGFAGYRVLQKQSTSVTQVSWQLGNGGIWKSSGGTPPSCPSDPILSSPVDLSLVSSVLYPGQVRANAFKPQGGFRFDNLPNNDVTVTAPMDAVLVRGTKGLYSGQDEIQYGFEFIAPCGIMYTFGHLHTLSPKFQAIADKLPLITDYTQQQLRDIVPTVNIKKGEIIATQVGIVHTKNVFVELLVRDLRHNNGKSIRPEWFQYSDEFDNYAVCWFDMLPAKDASVIKALPGADSVNGKKSDYCSTT